MGIFDWIFGKKNKKSAAHPTESKPTVHKIVLFWLDNLPEKGDVQAIVDLLPQQMHPELYFKTTTAINDRLSTTSILELMNEIIITVSAKLYAQHMADFDKKTLTEMAQQRAMHIAVMQLIEKRLQKKHRFKHADHPNKLICKFIETTTGPCYYTLILGSDIDPSNYEFATGIGGCKLSTLFTEAVNTGPS